jgi:hypothetical protein
MGSEILDSSGGARPVAPEQALPGPSAVPLLELDELSPVAEPLPTPAPRAPVRRAWRRLRHDRGARRATIRTVVLCLVIMALTASVVEFRASRQDEAERNGRVAVDIRVASIQPAENGGSEGNEVDADITIHNLGPAVIELTALDVANGGDPDDIVIANNVGGTSAPVEPGVNRETSYRLQLPCRPSFQLGFGPPQMIARIRTVDNAIHAVPVNLDTINQSGGLLTACISQFDDGPDAQVDYGSVSDGHSVTITIGVPHGPRPVALVAPEIGVPVRLVSVPALPADVQGGRTLVIKVTPTVKGCPRTHLDFDALQGFGVSVGQQQFSDPYLPALVAQAAGLACGGRRR